MNSAVSEAGFSIGASLKGMREGGVLAPLTAIANAVCDALAPLGVEASEASVRPGRVRAALVRTSTTAGWPEGSS